MQIQKPIAFENSVKASVNKLKRDYEQALEQFAKFEIVLDTETPNNEVSKQTASQKLHVHHAGVRSVLTIDYYVTEKRRWFRASTWGATLTLSCNKELFEVVAYEIPSDNTKIIQGVCNSIAKKGFRFEDEIRLLPAIEAITGLSGISRLYFTHKHQKLALDIRDNISEKLQALQSNLDRFAETAADVEVEPTLLAERYLTAQKARVDEQLRTYEKNHERNLDKYRAASQKKLDGLVEDNEKLKAKLEQQLEKLEKKLKGQRDKIDEQYFQLVPILNDNFPDIDSRAYVGRINYDTKVDAHLKTYYALLLKKELYSNEWFDVPSTGELLKLIRESCYAKNRRPEGSELRECMAGILAVFDYIEQHEKSADELLALFKESAKQVGSPKPTVEEFLETTLHYDFKMDKYSKKLHREGAINKKQLGLK